MKKRLLFLAALAAALVLFARCEGDTVGEPSPAPDDSACLGEKADDPSCQNAPLESDPTDTTKGSKPDTAPPEVQKPKVDYKNTPCPGWGCTLFPTRLQCDDCWDRWDCGQPPDYPPPVTFTGEETAFIPIKCGLPEPTSE